MESEISDEIQLTLTLESCREVLLSANCGGYWLLIDTNFHARRDCPDCMTLFNLLGVEEALFTRVHGTRWRQKVNEIAPGFQLGSINNRVKCVTVIGDDNVARNPTFLPTPDGNELILNSNQRFIDLRALIREKVEVKIHTHRMYNNMEISTMYRNTTAVDESMDESMMDTSFETNTTNALNMSLDVSEVNDDDDDDDK